MSNNPWPSTSTNKPVNNEPGDPKPRETPERDHKFFFDNTLIAIQIENTLFNIHKYQLLKSETFSDMFKVPKTNVGEPEEGSSPEIPIIMEGVKASDFRALLEVLYASHFSTHQPEPEASLIIPAFRLANMWNFSDLRAFLLPLAENHLSDIDKILFAREFDIKDWLAPAHIRLCERKEKLTTEEARKLGVDSVLLIARLGQRGSLPPKTNFTPDGNYCHHCVAPEGFSYHGTDYDCMSCQGDQAVFKYKAPSSSTGGNRTNASLEAEVKKWVRDGCMFNE